MAEQEQATKERQPRRRWRRRLGWTLAALAVLIGLATVFVHPLLKITLVRYAASKLDWELEIDSITGSLAFGAEFTGVHVTATSGPLENLTATRLGARYSLWSLMLGEPDWLHEITLDRAVASVDLTASSSGPETDTAAAWPKTLPPVVLMNCGVQVAGANWRLEMPAFDAKSERSGSGNAVSLNSRKTILTTPKETLALPAFDTAWQYQDGTWSSKRLLVAEQIRRVEIVANLNPPLDLFFTLKEGNGSITLAAQPNPDNVTVSGQAEQFDLFAFWQSWNLPGEGRGLLDGTFAAELDFKRFEASEGTFDLEVARVRLPGEIEVDAILEGRIDGGLLQSRSARLSLGANHLSVADLEWDLAPLFHDPVLTPATLLPKTAKLHANFASIRDLLDRTVGVEQLPFFNQYRFLSLLADVDVSGQTLAILNLELRDGGDLLQLEGGSVSVPDRWSALERWTGRTDFSCTVDRFEHWLPKAGIYGALSLNGTVRGNPLDLGFHAAIRGQDLDIPTLVQNSFEIGIEGRYEHELEPTLLASALTVTHPAGRLLSSNIGCPLRSPWRLQAESVDLLVEDLRLLFDANTLPWLEQWPAELAVSSQGALQNDRWDFQDLVIRSAGSTFDGELNLFPSNAQNWIDGGTLTSLVEVPDSSAFSLVWRDLADTDFSAKTEFTLDFSADLWQLDLQQLELSNPATDLQLVHATTLKWEPKGELHSTPLSLADDRNGLTLTLEGGATWDGDLDSARLDAYATFAAGDTSALAERWQWPAEFHAVAGNLSLRGPLMKPDFLAEWRGRCLFRDPLLAGREPVAVQGKLLGDEHSFAIDALTAESADVTLEMAGEWQHPWLPMLAGEDWSFTDVRGSGKVDVVDTDLTLVQDLVPGIRRIGGELTADLTVEGSLVQPDVTGHLYWKQGELRLDAINLASLTEVTLACSFRDQRLTVEECTGLMGYEPFEVMGDVVFDETPVVDLGFTGTNVLLTRSRGIKVRGSPDLSFRGTMDAMTIAGSLDFTDTYVSKNFDLLFFLRDQPERPTQGEGFQLFSIVQEPIADWELDVALDSKNGIVVKTNILQTRLRPEARLRGTLEVPYLTGKSYVDSTVISLPASTLTAAQGSILFSESNPLEPELELLAETRMIGYDIDVYVSGNMLAPRITMTSVPPLSEEDLLLLVTTGQPPEEEFARGTGERALSSVAVFLAKDILRNTLSDESTETSESFLDRFELETGRDMSRSGTETIEARYRLLNDVLLKRDSLYLEAERSIFDELNMGLRLVFRFQ